MKSNIEKVWTTEEGYTAVVLINTNSCVRCGYVGIPENLEIFDEDVMTYNVHGGITFDTVDIKKMQEVGFTFKEDYPIATDTPTRWLGFDAGHYGDGCDFDAVLKLCETDEERDIIHSLKMNYINHNMCVKDKKTIEYMVDECNKLSKQIKESVKLAN